jgi:single-strand DNA-binding protein
MSNDSTIFVVGNLTKDPAHRTTPGGKSVCDFTVAVNERISDGNGGFTDGEATFYKVINWEGQADNIRDSLTSGTRVMVHGNLKIRKWENNDHLPMVDLEIHNAEVGPSLKWATATVTRRKGNANSNGASNAASNGGGNGGSQNRSSGSNGGNSRSNGKKAAEANAAPAGGNDDWD